jgi:hypothetical protein
MPHGALIEAWAAAGGWTRLQVDFTDEGAAPHRCLDRLVPCGTHIRPAVVRDPPHGLPDVARAFNGEVDMTQLLARGQATSEGRYRDLIELGRLTGAAKKARLKAAAGVPAGEPAEVGKA